MNSRVAYRALGIAVCGGAMMLAGCSTPESRISDHPEIFQTLSPNDQALVSRGQIRSGMSNNAVWVAWGSPDQRAAGAMRGRSTETWIYFTTTTGPYGYGYGPYGYGGGYGGYGPGGLGYGFAGVVRSHGHRNFVFFGDPFYDPFYYSYIPPTVSYPYKTVTFSNGRVVSFQYLVGPYHAGP